MAILSQKWGCKKVDLSIHDFSKDPLILDGTDDSGNNRLSRWLEGNGGR